MLFDSFLNFFFCDGPVIYDLIRFIIYSYLLVECFLSKYHTPWVGDSPLQAHLLLERTHPFFWCIANKFSSYFLVIHKYKYLKALVYMCKISWVCCIFGFGGVYSRFITGASAFILSTTVMGIGKVDVNHRWYVPTWTLIALIFTKFKVYSVDWLINHYIDNRYNVELDYVIFDSGFSSKLIQLISLYTLFAGGISKLRSSGIQWMHPGTLIFYLSDPLLEKGIFLASKFRGQIRKMVIKSRWFVSLMASQTLLIELIVILGIIISSIRVPVVILAWSLHFGIWFLMGINYMPQCVCYLMIIDNPFMSTYPHYENLKEMVTIFDLIWVGLSIIVMSGFAYSVSFAYEGWPFSPFPMFSMDRHLFVYDYIIDKDQLYYMAETVHMTNGICHDGEFSENGMWLRITKNDETKCIIDDISSRVCNRGFQLCLWSAIMRSILDDKIEIDIFIRRLFDILTSDDVKFLQTNDYINIKFHFKTGWETYATTLSHKRD